MSTQHLWATAPDLDGIRKMIRDFYCMPKDHDPVGASFAPNCWLVHKASGPIIASVQVRLHKGRYRFEDRPQ